MRKVILIAAAADHPRFDWSLPLLPPLGILALGSYLAVHDIPYELIDMQMDFGIGTTPEVERIVCQRVARYLFDQADDISWIGISQLANGTSGVVLAEEIHKILPDVPIVFGGYFASGIYQRLLEEYPFVTAVVRGDGEMAALQISRSLDQGCSFFSEQIPNLAWRENGTIRTASFRPVALNDLPIMDFRPLRNLAAYQVIGVMTSWGCPYRCNYCLENCMRPYAAHDPAWVDRQLSHLEAVSSSKWFIIIDPIFGLNREHTIQLCQVMRQYPFAYTFQSRVDVVAPDLIPLLRQAGVQVIFWGIESASTETLLRMNKVRSKAQAVRFLQQARALLKACFENEVTPVMGVMVGFPGDSEADLQITLEFIKEMSQLSNQISAQTGLEAGFIPGVQPTAIYDGSPLADRMKYFPDTVLSPASFSGEKAVLLSSPGVDVEMITSYLNEMEQYGHYTPLAIERMEHYFGFSVQDFVAAHPESRDEQGVVKFV